MHLDVSDDLNRDLGVMSSAGTIRVSRLRSKRSLPPLQSLAPDMRNVEPVSDTSEEERGTSPLTPRPFPSRHSPDHLARRKSSPRRRIRKTSRGDHPATNLEPPVMISEEEGVKGDDEDDYNDLINAYSTDDVDSN